MAKTAKQRDKDRVASQHSDELVFEMLNKMSAYAQSQFKKEMQKYQSSFTPNSGTQSQSVSNGAVSHGSETEQQRPGQFGRSLEHAAQQKRQELNQQLNQNNHGLQKKITQS